MQIGRNEPPVPPPGATASPAPKAPEAKPEVPQKASVADRFSRQAQAPVGESEKLAQLRSAVEAATTPKPEAASEGPRTAGVPDHWLSKWAPWLRSGVVAGSRAGDVAEKWVRNKVLKQEPDLMPNPATPKERAEQTWKTIEDRYGIPGLKGFFAEGDKGWQVFSPATVWPHGQAVAAALDVAQLTGDYSKVDAAMKALSAYHTDGAYAPSTLTGTFKRLWDDNAWIGLDFLQAYKQTGNKDYLAKAEGLFPFMKKGLHKDGGIYWEEGAEKPSRNTCANAPAIQYAARLYQETKDPKYLEYAQNLETFMNGTLRSPEGLYFDKVEEDGKIEKSIWSYNQGAAIGANLQMYQITGDPKSLERARETANAALEYFGQEDRLWKQPPSFNAIFFRNLLALDAVAPDPRYRKMMEGYVDRVWKEGRDPRTGELNRGGIGKYDPPGLLDQSGLAQMAALLDWPKEKLHQVG